MYQSQKYKEKKLPEAFIYIYFLKFLSHLQMLAHKIIIIIIIIIIITKKKKKQKQKQKEKRKKKQKEKKIKTNMVQLHKALSEFT